MPRLTAASLITTGRRNRSRDRRCRLRRQPPARSARAATRVDRRRLASARRTRRRSTCRASRWQAVDLLDRDARARAPSQARGPPSSTTARAPRMSADRGRHVEATFAINVRGTHHLIEGAARLRRDARVLIPSSAMVYARVDAPLNEDHRLMPASPYAAQQAGAGTARRRQRRTGRRCSSPGRSTISGRGRIRGSWRPGLRAASRTSKRADGSPRSRSATSTRAAISPTCATRCARTG